MAALWLLVFPVLWHVLVGWGQGEIRPAAEVFRISQEGQFEAFMNQFLLGLFIAAALHCARQFDMARSLQGLWISFLLAAFFVFGVFKVRYGEFREVRFYAGTVQLVFGSPKVSELRVADLNVISRGCDLNEAGDVEVSSWLTILAADGRKYRSVASSPEAVKAAERRLLQVGPFKGAEVGPCRMEK